MFSMRSKSLCCCALVMTAMQCYGTETDWDLSDLRNENYTAVGKPDEGPFAVYQAANVLVVDTEPVSTAVFLSTTWTSINVHASDDHIDPGLDVLDGLSCDLWEQPHDDRSLVTVFKRTSAANAGDYHGRWNGPPEGSSSLPTFFQPVKARRKKSGNRAVQQVSNTLAKQPASVHSAAENPSAAALLTLSAPLLAIVVAVGMMALIVRYH